MRGATVRLKSRNSDGVESAEFIYTRPSECTAYAEISERGNQSKGGVITCGLRPVSTSDHQGGKVMKYRQPYNSAIYWRATALVSLMVVLAFVSTRLRADAQTTGTCGGVSVTIPFTDVPGNSAFLCAIAAAYFSGLTNGTTATTYSPSTEVTREQMAAFVSRTLDQSLRRGSRRAALRQWGTPAEISPTLLLGATTSPQLLESDGEDIWVAIEGSDRVARMQASSGRPIQTFLGATNAYGVVVARGQVYVTGNTNPGLLFRFDPGLPTNETFTFVEANDLGAFPRAITYDGLRIWTANFGGSVSIRTFAGVGSSTQTISTGFVAPVGILYDGSHVWVSDPGDDQLKKLNANGTIALSVAVGSDPFFPVFDGMNIWAPNKLSGSVTVVRVKDSQGNPLAQPFVLATLTGNGLDFPVSATFDGQRILVTNQNGNSLSLWKATDLTPLGFVSTGAGTGPLGACSDGINFFITLNGTGQLVRF
jgi:hypothetical protein